MATKSNNIAPVEPGALPGEGWIPLCVPEIAGNEWRYVKECLDTGWVSSAGSYVDRFEKQLADVVGCRHAIAIVNGTAALHVALEIAGVAPGDEVVMSDLTFIAPANAVRYTGAIPVFIDAEPEYWQIDTNALAAFLTDRCSAVDGVLRNKATGRRVAAILPVHILGSVCDLDPILELGRRFNLPVVEDATEGLGATYDGRAAGSYGALGCFSFNGNKLITSGGGGMIVTNDDRLAARAKYLTTQAKDDAVEFVHGDVGYNYRLPNVLAAIGSAQLERLEECVRKKRAIAAEYTRAIAGLPGVFPMREAPRTASAFWMYTIRIDPAAARLGSRDLLARFEAERVQTRPLWQPMHVSPAHRAVSGGDCPVAERLNRECLSLPCSVGLTAAQQRRVIDLLTAALRRDQ